MSASKAAKVNGVFWSILKHNFKCDNKALVPKMRRPYALTTDLKLDLSNYIINVQELGFELTILQVEKIAYTIAKELNVDFISMKRKNLLANGGG